MTDHGCSLGERKGEKCYGVFTYDYTIRTFAYFIYPELIPQNIEIKDLTRTIDVMPTVLDILGIPLKEGYKKMQGTSLLPLMIGTQDQPEREAYIETGGLGGPNPSPYKPNIKAIRTREWKLIYNETTGKKELYNLENDPEELRDVSAIHSEVLQELLDKITRTGN